MDKTGEFKRCSNCKKINITKFKFSHFKILVCVSDTFNAIFETTRPPQSDKSDVGTDEEFDDGLDEDLVGDDEDRKKLAGMTEREREEELFKRAEKREEARKRFVRLHITYFK